MLPTEPTSAGRSTRLLWLPTGKPSASIPATSSGRSGDQLADAELSMKISQLFGVLYHGTARNTLAFHPRSEEHTSELQSLMRISYAVFCLKKKQTLQL